MFDNVTQAARNNTTERKNNRIRSKVFDPCISTKKKKSDEDNFGDENDSFRLNNQLNTIKKHLLSNPKKDLNKTMDDLCDELGMSKYISEDDLSGDDSPVNSVARDDDSIENCLNKMFQGLDNYAAFNARGINVSTPKETRRVFSALDSNIKPTPGFGSDGLRTRSILKQIGDDNNAMSPTNRSLYKSPYSENKRISSGSKQFNEFGQSKSCETPLSDKTNIFKTPEQNNGFSTLVDKTSRKTPASPLVSESLFTPKSTFVKSLSPDFVEICPEIKRTLLAGLACYIEVRTNKEDCSSSVALELLSMGATVEKTFNKKVTHVIFKEGKPSTYLKAKKNGIKMVSVLWLEACKKERKLVDPELYPPVNTEKYESLSPNGRKLPTLKTIQRKLRKHLLREAGLLNSETKTSVRINWRNAITDLKLRPNSSQEGSQGRLCTKRLDFQITDQENPNHPSSDVVQSQHSIITISDTSISKSPENENNSQSSGDCQIFPTAERRNSAPGRFITERRKRKRKEEVEPLITASQKYITIDKLFAKQMTLNEAKRPKHCNYDENSNSTQNSQIRKRRLFNPQDPIIILDTPDKTAATPPPVVYDFPYKDTENILTTGRKVSSKSTSVRKIFTKVIRKKPAAKKSLTSLLEKEECSTSSRNSLTYFVDSKRNEPKLPKEPPTIVCTSLLPEEVRKAAYIVGKLGIFDIEDKVSSRTTHLITSAPRRTVNLLKALVRGAWILHVDWLYKCEEVGYWLNEEEYELKTFSPAVTEMRRERQAFGSQFCSELFSKCGSMYISKRSVPSNADLTELIRLCKGCVVSNPRTADFIIGGKAVSNETVIRLKEKWILDSITQNTLLDMERYLIKVD